MKVVVKYQFEDEINIENHFYEIEKRLGINPRFYFDKKWLMIIAEYENKSIEYLSAVYDCLLDYLLVDVEMVIFITNKTNDKITITN